MLKTPFTEITGCKVPIQLAGMPGITTNELAAAVSNSGGLGMISGTHMSPEFLLNVINNLKRITSDPFGVNFLMPFLDRDSVEVAASKTRIVEFFYGDPDPSLIEIVHNGGALACWQIGSKKEAILAENAGCDLIVAQGTESGGHVRGNIELLPLLSEVLDIVSVPIIAAGGIGTAKDVAEVLRAGASCARIGTRFLAAKESGAHPRYVKALIEAEAGDTVLTETFSVGWPHAHHRVLKSCVDQVNSFEGNIVGERDLAGVKKPVPKGSIALPTIDTTGKIEAMALYAGESVGAVKTVKSAAGIMNELIERI
jgi:NAD(P)H-dependent flavin oxidoreductase YrpB (nitropropane dioxygenase family)